MEFSEELTVVQDVTRVDFFEAQLQLIPMAEQNGAMRNKNATRCRKLNTWLSQD